jgi:hypothetical protein
VSVFAVAFNHAELALLQRAVREYAEREDSPLAADVLEILEGALDERDRAWLGMSAESEATSV